MECHAVFQVPALDSRFPRSGRPHVEVAKPKRSNTGFMQGLLLMGLVGLLFSDGRSNGQSVFADVTAEAGLFTGDAADQLGGTPGVRVSWRTDLFMQGTQQKYKYQVWRSQTNNTPVNVVYGSNANAVDSTVTAAFGQWHQFTVIGGFACPSALPAGTDLAEDIPLAIVGQPYQYQAELIYVIDALDLPVNDGCAGPQYYISERTAASGFATPLDRVSLQFPGDNETISAPVTFSFIQPTGPVTLAYGFCVELSTQPTFPAGQTVAVSRFVRPSAGTQSTPTQVDTTGASMPAYIRNASEVWWRVGTRNVSDSPGPVRDSIGERYVFSQPRRFQRPTNPPGGPGGPPLASQK